MTTPSSTTPFSINYDETFPFSNTCGNVLLAASTAISYTVPGTANQTFRAHISVSYSADVWVSNNGTAIVPVSNTMATTAYQERVDEDFNRYVIGGDVLSFISTGTPQVGISLLLVSAT